jgi:hypothetical protein
MWNLIENARLFFFYFVTHNRFFNFSIIDINGQKKIVKKKISFAYFQIFCVDKK